MATFIEVRSAVDEYDDICSVNDNLRLINIDHITCIAPADGGGARIFMDDDYRADNHPLWVDDRYEDLKDCLCVILLDKKTH